MKKRTLIINMLISMMITCHILNLTVSAEVIHLNGFGFFSYNINNAEIYEKANDFVALNDIPEPTAAPVTTDITTTAVDDVPKSTTAPVTTDITTTETTVVTTQIPTISAVVSTTRFGIYESAYVHSLKSPPNKTVYEIGDELDLTGLKVDLEFYDQQGGHHTIYRDAYPLNNPDFIVDTSNFDSSKAGTYKIKISCADKFTAFYLPGPVYFEVTVNDPNSAVTTTSTSSTENTTATTSVTTDITTTENTVVTTSIPIVTSISPITSLYQRAYHLDIHHLPNKTNYNIGDKLDLTGLTVDLRYNDESNIYYNTYYISAYPLDYPDVFTVDTSNFDNSKAGTYTIKISCKYEAIHWYPPSTYLKVTVNDSSLATTTTSTSSTDITTTVTTTITAEADTEQTTEPPATDAGGSVTTETSTVPSTTTTGTETTLPQTGYSKWYQALIAAAMGMIGVGSTAIVRSGIFRKKKSNS